MLDIAYVSTHSRPKAAVLPVRTTRRTDDVSTHSRPKAAEQTNYIGSRSLMFQHTAARRRLVTNRLKPFCG